MKRIIFDSIFWTLDSIQMSSLTRSFAHESPGYQPPTLASMRKRKASMVVAFLSVRELIRRSEGVPISLLLGHHGHSLVIYRLFGCKCHSLSSLADIDVIPTHVSDHIG